MAGPLGKPWNAVGRAGTTFGQLGMAVEKPVMASAQPWNGVSEPGTLEEHWNDVLSHPSEPGTTFGESRRKRWNGVWGAWNGVWGACNGVWGRRNGVWGLLERRLDAWDVGGALE